MKLLLLESPTGDVSGAVRVSGLLCGSVLCKSLNCWFAIRLGYNFLMSEPFVYNKSRSRRVLCWVDAFLGSRNREHAPSL